MPRCHFDAIDGDECLRDGEGSVLPDKGAALIEATLAVAELARIV